MKKNLLKKIILFLGFCVIAYIVTPSDEKAASFIVMLGGLGVLLMYIYVKPGDDSVETRWGLLTQTLKENPKLMIRIIPQTYISGDGDISSFKKATIHLRKPTNNDGTSSVEECFFPEAISIEEWKKIYTMLEAQLGEKPKLSFQCQSDETDWKV